MTTLRKSILFLVTILFMSSILLVNPITTTHDSVTKESTEISEDIKEIQDYYNKVKSPEFTPEVHHLLTSWQNGEDVSDSLIMQDGKPSITIYGTNQMSFTEVEQKVELTWKADLKALRVVKAYLPSSDAIEEILTIEGVTTISANELSDTSNDLIKNLNTVSEIEPGLDMEQVREIVKSSATYTRYTGEGVTIGHVDTGCDFGHPALQHAYHQDSFDPSGFSLVPTITNANTTEIIDTEDWLLYGNILTYENEGKIYINTTDWDPWVNNQGSARSLMGLLPPYGDGYPYGSNVGFVGVYEWAWEINNASEFVATELWKDWEIPSSITGNISLGWVFQQRQNPYTKMFAPALLFQEGNEWNLVIDWEGAEGWTAFWNGGMYWESLDLNNTVDRTKITDLFDWSFADDYADGDIYNLSNPIVAEDIDGDGIDDFSLGALSWTYDADTWFQDEKMFKGFRSDGEAFALYFDHGTHGTATAAHIAAKDNLGTFYDEDNERYTNLTGIAPDAKILSVSTLTTGVDYGGYLWICGFDYNETTDRFYYNATSTHQADLTSNSWGWITEPSSEFNYISMTWTILSVPDYLDASYPGVLHVFSAGNEGAGFMTGGPPGCSPGVLTVGASTASEWLGYLYGDTQPYSNGLANFASKGPNFSGYPKPDVVAPGFADFSANPWYSQYLGQYYYPSPYGYVPTANTTLFSGTSQAAPIAAGVAALVVEAAASTLAPSRIKTILQSSAGDLGYGPATQGFGLVNAEEACDFADGSGGFIGETIDSFNNVAEQLDNAYDYWGVFPISSITGTVLESQSSEHPRNMDDASIYFGLVMPTDTVTVNYKVYNAGNVTPEDATGTTYSAGEYTLAESYSFQGQTFSYNDTVVTDSQMYGWYNLSYSVNNPLFDVALNQYNYMTIVISFNASDVAGYEPWSFLYDWTDSNGDEMPNQYNQSTGIGDELDRLGSASDPSNINMMPYAVRSSETLYTEHGANLTIVIHDPIHDIDMSAIGNDFTCKILFWQISNTDLSGSGEINLIEDDGLPNTYNISLDVPIGADYGIHQGYIFLQSYNLTIPYSYNVVANLTGNAGAIHTIVDGAGDQLQPFDAPMYGCMESDPDDWDFRSFVIYNPNTAASNLAARVEWPTLDNNMTVEILTSSGQTIAENGIGEPYSTGVITDSLDTPEGYYYILIHATELSGFIEKPANYTLEVMWYDLLPDEEPILQWKSNDQPSFTQIMDEDNLVGDHVIINATYPEFNLVNMPEYEITEISMNLYSGLYKTEFGNLVIPSPNYDPFSGIIDTSQFAWEYISGIKENEIVDITCEFNNEDSDIMVWWQDTDSSSWSFVNNLVGNSMNTSNNPESGQFIANRDGTLAIGIFDFSKDAGTYLVSVDTRRGFTETADSRTLMVDSYRTLGNGVYGIQITARTGTNNVLSFSLSSINITNFFAPEISNLVITGEDVKTVEWDISDRNADDEHIYDIYLSQDDGLSFQLLNSDFKGSQYIWDSTGFLSRENYIIKIVAFDNSTTYRPLGYAIWPGLTDTIISDKFSAGTVIPAAPIIDHPSDITFENGTIGNFLSWHLESDIPDSYVLTLNGDMLLSGNWDGSNISIILDWLSPGSYIFELTVNDTVGQSVSDSVNVIVTADGTDTSTSTTTETTTTTTNPEIVDPVMMLVIIGGGVGIIAIIVVIISLRKRG
ncbi:MAG: S8 family serine peptidase [Candidatus Lokiarchaeota archaeon]|nr:S8 family serine peptidase [Candidatus Lokiarchaeota archaeon]